MCCSSLAMSNPDHSQPVGCGIDERGADRPIVLLVRKDYRAGSCSRQVYLTVCAQSYGKNVARMSTTAHRFAHYLYLRAQRTRSASSVTCTQARSVHAYATTRAREGGVHTDTHARTSESLSQKFNVYSPGEQGGMAVTNGYKITQT